MTDTEKLVKSVITEIYRLCGTGEKLRFSRKLTEQEIKQVITNIGNQINVL